MPETYTENSRPVIIFGDSITAWGVISGLKELDIEIYLVSEEGNGIATFSKYVTQSITLNSSNASYVEQLIEWIHIERLDQPLLLIAGNDNALEVLSKSHEQLIKVATPTFPPWTIVEKVIHKEHSYSLAKQLGIPTIDTIKVSSEAELNQAIKSEKIPYPALLKCSKSIQFSKKFKTKGIICENAAEILQAFNDYEGFFGHLLIQDYIPGDLDNIHAVLLVLDQQSKVIDFFVNEKLRAQKPYASTSLSVSTWDTKLLEQAIRMAETLGYVGNVGIQFKKDPRNGEYKFLEINGRFSVSVSLAVKCDVNMPRKVYETYCGPQTTRLTEFKLNYKKKRSPMVSA